MRGFREGGQGLELWGCAGRDPWDTLGSQKGDNGRDYEKSLR